MNAYEHDKNDHHIEPLHDYDDDDDDDDIFWCRRAVLVTIEVNVDSCDAQRPKNEGKGLAHHHHHHHPCLIAVLAHIIALRCIDKASNQQSFSVFMCIL